MSDAHGYTAANIMEQLPHVLSIDVRMHALAMAITKVLLVRFSEIPLEEIYLRIDELPEDLLDILAVDFAVDWWDGNWTVDRKRQTIKDSWKIHKILGTPKALDMAVQAAFGDGHAEEWFNYGGKPHHFRVVGLSLEMAQNGYDSFLRLLSIVKRESSVLDEVVMESLHEQSLRAGCGVCRCNHVTIDCGSMPLNIGYVVDEIGEMLTDEQNTRYIDYEV